MLRGRAARLTVSFARELGKFGDACALISAAGEWSYTDLAERVEHWADFLGPRRRLVLVELEPDLELIAIYLAALAGSHPVLIAPCNQPDFTRALIENYDPELVFGAGQPDLVRERLTEPARLHPELALLLSTATKHGELTVLD